MMFFARRLLRGKRFNAKTATCLIASHPVQAPPVPAWIYRPRKLATIVAGAMTPASPGIYDDGKTMGDADIASIRTRRRLASSSWHSNLNE
ncbi:hypothetical protein RPHASCH2410_CH12880 [Rhizobium phaseoli Ch24-10]|nr:hypothetical protein RPHASCH2410_CH12880 [Rhizobium phaseoli Ch24-10]